MTSCYYYLVDNDLNKGKLMTKAFLSLSTFISRLKASFANGFFFTFISCFLVSLSVLPGGVSIEPGCDVNPFQIPHVIQKGVFKWGSVVHVTSRKRICSELLK